MASAPLWKAMEAAFLAGRKPGNCDRLGYAAEIRALVEARLPEEDPIDLMQLNFADIEHLARWITRDERQRLRALLLADAALAAEDEPTFTPEEVELIQAPWSYLSPDESAPPADAAEVAVPETPLWKMMYAARHGRPVGNDPRIGQDLGHLYAAELRAIAEEIAMRFEEHAPASEINTWLMAEADRAERGEEA